MPKDLTKVAEGESLGTSSWMTITQDTINDFANATGDHQWIHVDSERCKTEGPYGTTIAHGFLSASLMSHVMQEMIYFDDSQVSVLNYGIDSLRFLEPVRCDDQVRYHISVASRVDKALGIRIQLECEVEIKDRAKPAMKGRFLILIVKK